MGKLIKADPANLRLPPERAEGADPFKLSRQVRDFGGTTDGMLPVVAIEGRDGELMLLDGVTRSTRMALLKPGTLIEVEVIGSTQKAFSSLPRVGERI